MSKKLPFLEDDEGAVPPTQEETPQQTDESSGDKPANDAPVVCVMCGAAGTATYRGKPYCDAHYPPNTRPVKDKSPKPDPRVDDIIARVAALEEQLAGMELPLLAGQVGEIYSRVGRLEDYFANLPMEPNAATFPFDTLRRVLNRLFARKMFGDSASRSYNADIASMLHELQDALPPAPGEAG